MVARVLRTLVHFGPWRVIPQRLIRQFRPIVTEAAGKSLLDGLKDATAIAEEVRQQSVAIVGVLPPGFLQRVRAVTDHLPIDHYQLMHHIDENVRELSEDCGVKNVLRAYFKCEPVLLESTLVITGCHQTLGISEQNSFHFDYAGWQSLNLFVYLSDVTEDASCHMVAKGSHRNIPMRDLIRGSMTDEEAQLRFGASIQRIAGPAGTVFFENTEAFHRRNPGEPRRAILNLLYASHRGWLSHGRTSLKHVKKRAQAYDRLRAVVPETRG